jgi:hypothetical protein
MIPEKLSAPVTAYESALALIKAGECLMPADVAEACRSYIPIEGTERVFLPPAHKNVVIYAGASEALAAILDTLLTDPALEMIGDWTGAHVAAMLGDIELPMPLVKRPPRGGYRAPHWLPVVIRTGALEVSGPGHNGTPPVTRECPESDSPHARGRGDHAGSPDRTDREPKGTKKDTQGTTKRPPDGLTRTHAHARA